MSRKGNECVNEAEDGEGRGRVDCAPWAEQRMWAFEREWKELSVRRTARALSGSKHLSRAEVVDAQEL